MKTRKFIKLVFISVGIAGFLFSCKKENKEDTVVHFHLYNPVTNEAYSGVKVAVYELKDVTPTLSILSDSKYDSNKIWEGVTDIYGKASHSFKTYKKDKYTYWHSVDESFIAGKKKVEQPEYGPLSKNTINKTTYKVVHDNINYIRWVKNMNCFDNNDKCRWRRKSIVDIYDSNWRPWSPLVGSPSYPQGFYEGCFEHIYASTYTHKQDIWEIEMEVTKNGITTVTRDTFYLTGQNGTDTLKIFY